MSKTVEQKKESKKLDITDDAISKLDLDKKKITTLLNEPWIKEKEEIIDAFGTDQENGLDSDEVPLRKKAFGENILEKGERKSGWEILLNQFKDVLILLLAGATVFSFIFGEIIDGTAILLVIIINTALGFYTEYKAEKSIEALYELTKVESKVIRDGEITKIDAENLVIGDIAVIDAGDVVSADLRIIKIDNLQVNESALTGESVPVQKKVQVLEKEEVPVAERNNMLYKGTAITRGSGKGVVVAIGESTELGKISTLVKEAKGGETPLTRRLKKLARNLFWLTIGIAILVAIVGIVQGQEPLLMIESSIALAVAAVPEGLPVVATISLARGMWRMANKNALINRLSAVEALGSTNIICTDKTGTLTENRMTVTKIIPGTTEEVEISGTGLNVEGKFKISDKEITPEEHRVLYDLIQVGVFCNSSTLKKDDIDGSFSSLGDPMEVALLVLGAKAGVWRKKLLDSYPEERVVSFDPEVKMMATFNRIDSDEIKVSVKGAPENLLDDCTKILTREGKKDFSEEQKKKFIDKNQAMAENGLRILAMAQKQVDNAETDPYQDLIFLGLVGLLDPAREEVKPAIMKCKNAGIKIVMVTGDQAPTAVNVGKTVGIVAGEEAIVMKGTDIKPLEELTEEEKKKIRDTEIFARVAPVQKLRLVEIYQEDKSIIAMTGDGVNDAPALEKANIGVAMGQRGTQVAQEASDMILRDDNFTSISDAVEEGRVISTNIRKFLIYLLSCNISEILIIFVASLLGLPLPITPVQILFLNIVTDVFPALALAVCEGAENVMEVPPRDPDEPIMTKSHWYLTLAFGSLLTAVVMLVYFITLNNYRLEYVSTVTFLTLGFTQLWHAFNMRSGGSSFLKNEITQNKWMWGALALSAGILIMATYLPGLNFILGMVDPGAIGWLIILGASLITYVVGQLWSSFFYKSRLF